MVLTELTFFGPYENSLPGLQRGLISFIPLVIIGLIINWKNWVRVLIVSLFLCSAIGVQFSPNFWYEAFLYGFLVGVVVSVCVVSISFSLWRILIILPILLGLLSVLTYWVSTKMKLYPDRSIAKQLF